MSSPLPPADLPDDLLSQHLPGPSGSTRSLGETIDDGRGRIFPCEKCGADLAFSIGAQRLKCDYCGFEKNLEVISDATVAERDLQEMLERLVHLKTQGISDEQQTSEVRCESCGGQVVFTGTLTSLVCPYCASPIQRENIHDSPQRVPVDGVLPFLIDQKRAAMQFQAWVQSLWFAPNSFKKLRLDERVNGVYEPYWTFDFETYTRYAGERGDHYWVTVGQGKNTQRVMRTRWSGAAGDFHRFFDDLLCFASTGLPTWIAENLEPWPLQQLQPFHPQFLAGFLARTYDISLQDGFEVAQQRVHTALGIDVRQRIGGDTQRVHECRTAFNLVTYKHLLLPLWLVAYRYHDRIYRVAINGCTGELHGERPYSAWKITFLVLFLLAVAGLIAAFSQR